MLDEDEERMLADAAEGSVVASTNLANLATGGVGGARVALSHWSLSNSTSSWRQKAWKALSSL